MIGALLEIVELYFTKNVSRAASSLAYFLILTFFPILICVNAFIGMLDLDAEAIFHLLEGIIPSGGVTILFDYVNYLSQNQSSGMFVAGMVMTVMFASSAIRQLMNIMEEIYNKPSKRGPRDFVRSILFSVLFLVMIYVSMYVMLTSSRLFDELLLFLRLANPFDRVKNMGYYLLTALILLFILLTYRAASPKTKPAPPILPGACLSTIVLVVASMIFSNLMGASSRYSLVYGALSSVIILIVWLYLCGTILILGSIVNCVWYKHRSARGNLSAG